jgi:hypothetical protein
LKEGKMSNLSNERDYIVTGSNAFRVMAGAEQELQLQDYKFEPFEGWEKVKEMIDHGITDIKTLKCHVKGVTAERRDKVIEFLKRNKPFEITKGMESYAMDIARAYFIDEKEETYQSEAMKNGSLNEINAVIAAEEYLGVDFEATLDDQQFFRLENIGLTPDGILFDDLLLPKEGLEVKNPTQKVHFFNLYKIKTQDDLLKHYPEYYWQCMAGLLVTGAKKWHWFSHNETFGPYKLVHVEVLPIQKRMDLLLKRSELVVKRSKEIVEELNQYDLNLKPMESWSEAC